MVRTKTSREMPYETLQLTDRHGPGEKRCVTAMTPCKRRASMQPSPAHSDGSTSATPTSAIKKVVLTRPFAAVVSPRCPRTAINSPNPPLAATCQMVGSRGLQRSAVLYITLCLRLFLLPRYR